MSRACEMYPNRTSAAYRRHAEHSQEDRIRWADTAAHTALEYYHSIHTGDDGLLPTQEALDRLERISDFVLAEDHVKGLSILRDPYDRPRNEDISAFPGEGAAAYMRENGLDIACLADAEEAVGGNVKVCRTCGYPFEDRSRRKNKLDCGPSCRTRYKTLWMRVERFGTDELEGERNRMALEYPFYNPQEMHSLEKRSERSYGDSDKVSRMTAAKKRKEAHGRRITAVLKDERGSTENKYLDGRYDWVSTQREWRRESTIWWGEMVTYNIADQPLTPSFVDCKNNYTVHVSA